MGITMLVTYLDDETAEHEAHLPARWEICGHCHGTGQSSAYLGAFTRDEMHEQGPEFMEDYMRGHYDRPCDAEGCQGGKVLVLDRERIEARNDDREMDILRRYDSDQQELAEIKAIEAAERRMGA